MVAPLSLGRLGLGLDGSVWTPQPLDTAFADAATAAARDSDGASTRRGPGAVAYQRGGLLLNRASLFAATTAQLRVVDSLPVCVEFRHCQSVVTHICTHRLFTKTDG